MQNTLIFWVVVLYAVGGSIYFCISSYIEERKSRKKAEASLKLAEDSLKLILKLQETVAESDEYIQDLENAQGEMEEDRIHASIMATLLEEHTLELEEIHKHMDEQDAHTAEHCLQLNQLAAIRIQIVTQQPDSLNYDYAGPNEGMDASYDPYPEPTPMPEWAKRDIQDVEGLDAL